MTEALGNVIFSVCWWHQVEVQKELKTLEQEIELSKKTLEDVSLFYDQIMAQEEAIFKGYKHAAEIWSLLMIWVHCIV